jgi:hypothetical protein
MMLHQLPLPIATLWVWSWRRKDERRVLIGPKLAARRFAGMACSVKVNQVGS